MEIQATYRGRDLRLKVGSIPEQVDLMFAVALKGRAAQNRDLVNLLCEEDLVDDNSLVKKCELDFTLCRHGAAARGSVNSVLRARGDMDGPSVVAYLHEKEPSLRSIDHTFVIEISFLLQHVWRGWRGSSPEEDSCHDAD